MQGNNLQLLLIILVFGFSAISWVIGKLREQAAIKKARDELRRARDEQLRTGRTPEEAGSGPSEAKTRSGDLNELRELAMKRQRQLEQMKEMQQQQMRSQRTAAQTPTRDPRQVPGTSSIPPMPFPIPGTPLPTPKPGGGGGLRGPGMPGVPRPPKQQSRRQPMQPSGGVQDIRPGQPAMRPKPARPFKAEQTFDVPPFMVAEQATPRRLLADSPMPGSEAAPLTGVDRRAVPIGLSALLGRTDGGRPTMAEVRRAVILSEIFGPPVSARRGNSSGDSPIGG
ncbi:MAG: hypothetical protein ACKVZJ_03260 [Phycisphaerales bacterium]